MASINTLVLIGGINPNTKGNLYYVFDAPGDYYLNVLKPHQIAVLDEPNYRINNGTVIISTAGTVSVSSFNKMKGITYIVERKTDTLAGGYLWTFYHVNKIFFQTNKCYLTVTTDDFANGMLKCKMSDIHVTRVSRGNLDNFTESRNITYDGNFLPYGNYEIDDSESKMGYGIMLAVAKIDMVVSKDAFANNPITRSAFFAFDAYDLIAKYNTMDTTPADWLTKIQDMLGGTFEGATFSSETGQIEQMKCSAIYVVPATFLPAINAIKLSTDDTYNDVNLHVKSGLTGYTGWVRGHSVIPSHYEREYGYSLGRDAVNSVPFFGTRGQWMELPRRYKFGDVYIVCDASTGGLQIKAKQGSNEVDMTNAFVLPCSFTNDIDTESTQALKGVINGINVFTNIFKKGSKGNGVGAGMGFITDVMSLMNNNNSKSNSTDGNAFMTYCPKMGSTETQDDYFARIQTKWITNPVLFSYVTDISDGNSHVRFNGVSTDESYDSKSFLSTIASREYLGDLNATVPADTFVTATVSVQGIPEQEREAIENAFKDGIRYVYVTVE